ncbi:glycosyltransferase [Salinibacter ruber]|uniref:glycosyltransferase n=1 Tax=Salinibacter ruber TaxID=146919 RepID=UPI0021677A62|nr:glycosyltransferase [Salinibacter ruber]MCS4133935.1 glycosyltransferase involved in cell wall biosynthesis [Salinibacter ruber]
MEPITVLYLVGRVAPTSVPLEVAQFIEDARLRLYPVAFYKTQYSGESLGIAPACMEAESRYDLAAVCRLYRYIRRVQPDVLHVHHTMPAFWGALFGKGVMRSRLVRSEHNNYVYCSPGYPSQRAINTVSQGFADRVLCNSQNTYRSMESWRKRLLGEKWRVVYNGIDVDRIDRANSEDPPFEDSYGGVTVGSVGRLVDQKNYQRLVQAFAQVVEQAERECRLILIGDGDEREMIEEEVGRLGIDDHVILTGEVDRDAVYSALYAFDLFVVPSLSEGFCNAAVEAMAAGLPIVCSDIPTLREVIGDVAIYANPERPESFTRAIGTLLEEGKKGWRKRGDEARSRALEQYSIERTAKQYVESYLQVANEG